MEWGVLRKHYWCHRAVTVELCKELLEEYVDESKQRQIGFQSLSFHVDEIRQTSARLTHLSTSLPYHFISEAETAQGSDCMQRHAC